MKPKIADDIPPEVWVLFEKVRTIINTLPNMLKGSVYMFGIKLGIDIATKTFIPNCHVVAEALTRVLPLDAHHGVITTNSAEGKPKNLEHAWLTVRGLDHWIIIDPWPLGVVSGPALFVQDYAFHFGQRICLLPSEEFESEVETVVEAMRKILEM